MGVIRHHNNNRKHPFVQPPTGNNIKVTAPPPGVLIATDNGNYLEIRLTATDSNGTSRTISRRLDPRRVSVTFKVSPKHKPDLTVNGATIDAPKALVSWEGYTLDVYTRRRRSYVTSTTSSPGPMAAPRRTP